MVLAWWLSPSAARDVAVQSAAVPSGLTSLPTKVPLDRAGLSRAPNAGAVASSHPVGTEERAEPVEPSPQDYIDRARAEPRDDAWAGPTEQLFEEDLQSKANAHDFRIGAVECHTNTCTAELFWSSLREARADFKSVLGEPDRSRCQPRLILTEGAHDDAPEMGVMLLHCKSQRQRAARNAGQTPVDDDEEL
jgi:hypothetical protein